MNLSLPEAGAPVMGRTSYMAAMTFGTCANKRDGGGLGHEKTSLAADPAKIRDVHCTGFPRGLREHDESRCRARHDGRHRGEAECRLRHGFRSRRRENQT